MLIGEYQHSVDTKGRLNFPAKLRESLGESFIITKGLDGCLAVYSQDEWQSEVDKYRGLTDKKGRALQRYIFSGAEKLEPDKQGRILIPSGLREFAGLDKNVVVVGVSVRVEIWDKQKWDESQTLTDEDVVAMMEGIEF